VASERNHKVFDENQSIRGFFGFKSCFQNCFCNLFSTSGLSHICNIRNVWKLPSPFLRNTLISSSEKTSLSLKISFWKKNCPINSLTFMKNPTHVRLPCKSHGFRTSKSQNYGDPYLISLQFFISRKISDYTTSFVHFRIK
jgi:hypothetical protein